MIEFSRESQQTIPSSSVKIIGLGGAGANMLDRIALDGMEGAELLAVNTDIRTLASSVAGEKIQLGRNLTKGLGTGGDPDLGKQAMLEAEDEVRDAVRDRRIVFICVGLGGGTGSGAAPLVTRIAREEGAFVVVFATMPFQFEGDRRRQQAEEALNQLAVLSNALVTFDNGRMGQLVLAKQGIHEAFAAGDRMISESIKAVTRLVVRPGLINVGLDDLMSALRTTRSRCLFGSGLAHGKDRSHQALKNALNSPLLDQGSLLRDAETVLVHICGGEDLTLYEVELLMGNLSKHVAERAHILFGAAVDPGLGDGLTVTLISSLPEDKLHHVSTSPLVEKAARQERIAPAAEEPAPSESANEEPTASTNDTAATGDDEAAVDADPAAREEPEKAGAKIAAEAEATSPEGENAAPAAEPTEAVKAADEVEAAASEDEDVESPFTVLRGDESVEQAAELEEADPASVEAKVAPADGADEDSDLVQLPTKRKSRKDPQGELALEGGPRGKFEGESPNVFEGEDLDIPPFLRNRR